MRSEAQKRADAKYSNKTFCMTSIKSKRSICLNERIEKASIDRGMSKNAYILQALERQLSEDGYERPLEDEIDS